jgi:hypothetical protein
LVDDLNVPLRPVSGERSGIERGIRAVDGIRGVVGSLLVGGIGIAALRAGGTAGWALGIVLLLLAASGVALSFRPRG